MNLFDSASLVVGVSDAKTSADPAAGLVTYSLGSCIGVCLYDARVRVGGMLHFQLPDSAADPARAAEKPLMFADTGMAWLLGRMRAHGADVRRLKVHLAGAAEMMDQRRVFDIGRRNQAAIRKVLWQHGLLADTQHLGGKEPRTMRLNVADGRVTIRYPNEVVAA